MPACERVSQDGGSVMFLGLFIVQSSFYQTLFLSIEQGREAKICMSLMIMLLYIKRKLSIDLARTRENTIHIRSRISLEGYFTGIYHKIGRFVTNFLFKLRCITLKLLIFKTISYFRICQNTYATMHFWKCIFVIFPLLLS